MSSVAFFVPGIPRPGGSKRAFVSKSTGKINVTDACKRNKDWRASVALAAHEAMTALGLGPLIGALSVTITFRMPRPKDHFRTGQHAGELKAWAHDEWPTTKPDAVKLWRAAEDACNGIVWFDDSIIVHQDVTKRYANDGESAGMEFSVTAAGLPPRGV